MIWLRLTVIALLAGSVTGCAALGISSWGKPPASRSESLKQMNPARIQADTMGFADRFVTAMTGIYDELERRATTPVAKDAAHTLKTDLALGSISNAVNPRPIAGLFDMVVLVTLLRQIAEDPWATQTFGADALHLVQALKRQEADVRSMAKRYVTDAQLAELSDLADRWHRTHPDDRSVSHVHLADLPEANRPAEETGKLPSSVFSLLFFDPTSNLDPAVREIELSRATSERMFFYLQRLPLLLQLQGEGFYRQLLAATEFKQALQDVSAVAGSTTRFVENTSRFTDVVERFPQQFIEERQQALTQVASDVAQQRDAAIRQLADAVAVQREAAIRQLADAVAVQREAAITQATTRIASEREQAIAQMGSKLHEEQQAFVSNLEAATARSIDRLTWRLAVAGLVLAVAVAGVVLAFRRLSHQAR